MCFISMQLANQLELCLHKQTQIVASAACRVGSQEFHSWIASLPLVSLLLIVIPTPFLNFLNQICTSCAKQENNNYINNNMNNNNMEKWAVSAMCQKLRISPISYQLLRPTLLLLNSI